MNGNEEENQVISSNQNEEITPSQNQDDMYDSNNEGGDSKDEKMRRKRRSKNDPEGRAYKCEICGKSYLSRPAMTQHIKTKHSEKIGDYKRGRGRPKKCEGDTSQSLLKEIFYKNFFSKSHRSRKEGEDFDYKEQLYLALKELKSNFETIFVSEKPLDDHPLLRIDPDKISSEPKETTYDQNIIMYLRSVLPKVNKEYYKFICKFCFLFRSCVNQNMRKNSTSTEPFSERETAEAVPDMCNDFMTDFMDANNYFQLDSTEIIDIIQHFCNWLFESGLTVSMLTLLGDSQ